jgi:hypothetical protein
MPLASTRNHSWLIRKSKGISNQPSMKAGTRHYVVATDCCVGVSVRRGLMTVLTILQTLANIASIATSIVAVWAFWRFVLNRRRQRRRIEQHLRDERKNGRIGIAVIDIVAELGLSEVEVMHAAFRSRHINRLVQPAGISGSSPRIVLEYHGK